VQSELEKGTTFTVTLPHIEPRSATAHVEPTRPRIGLRRRARSG
jgi:hypothetical protein